MEDENTLKADELLKEIQRQEESNQLGELKIFFGMSAGVGKTYAMLEEAHRYKKAGVNVVVGCINTHGRKETEKLLQGLTIIPEKWIRYKDTVFEEFDIDAVIALKPDLVLVDELAHTNVPGSRHSKRWQDVLELLECGINVFTTLNVQHIESRKEIVEALTGIQIRETVPDLIVEKATNVGIVDISPAELLQRLKEGKVYLGTQSSLAAQNFFKEENLTALRELALRVTAEKVDHDLHGMMVSKGWVNTEKLMVAISSNPSSESLLRSSARLASELDASWIAVYVDLGKTLDDEEYARVNKHCNLARELGAEVITTHDTDIASALNRIAKQKAITRIVIGRSLDKKYRFFIPNIAQRLEKMNKDVDIIIIRQDKTASQTKSSLLNWINSSWREYCIAVGVILAVSFIGFINPSYIDFKILAFLFFLAIIFLSLFLSLGPILLASALSGIIWNYFTITELVVKNYQDTMLLIVYFCLVTLIAALTSSLRQQYQILREREKRIGKLYEIGQEISKSPNLRVLRSSVSKMLSSLFPGKFEILVKDTENNLVLEGHAALLKEEKEKSAALWVFERGNIAGWSTDTLPSCLGIYFPIKFSKTPAGVLVYKPERERLLSLDEINFIQAVALQLGVYLERYIFEERLNKQEYLRQIERLHSSIFHSLNRNFYSPLEKITEINHNLQKIELEPPVKHLISKAKDYITKIKFTADNVIAISELESGFAHFDKQKYPFDMVVKASFREIEKLIQGCSIVYEPKEEIIFSFDFKMLKLVINNLILNAITYSPSEKPVVIDAQMLKKKVKITVTDEGPGISEELLSHIFDKFYRVTKSNMETKTSGLGLGLAIVKSIMDIHNGKIEIKNREEGGTQVSLFLPID